VCGCGPETEGKMSFSCIYIVYAKSNFIYKRIIQCIYKIGVTISSGIYNVYTKLGFCYNLNGGEY